jgi:WD40 repeat protein
MSLRLLRLIISLLLVLLVVLLDIETQFVASDPTTLPTVFSAIKNWAGPLLGVTVLLLVGGTLWLYLLEHPAPAVRIWTASRSPYPGLEAFTEQDAPVFFGRESQINELVDRLHPIMERSAHRFVAVVGPSGVGKSSLVQAGLLARLTERRGGWVVVPPLLPGPHPLRSLAYSLAVLLPGSEAEILAVQLVDEGSAALIRVVGALRPHGDRVRPVLLVIDQAEELFTLTGARERVAFLELLRGALEQDPSLWVVATLRSEFLTGFLQADFADLFYHPVVIGTLDRAALVQVIEGPAAQVGLQFVPGLVQRMVEDTRGGDALPLLAYMLHTLYLRVGSGNTVTDDHYQQLGGVAGALSRQADKVSTELRIADPHVAVVDTLLKFVTLDETEPTRRRVQRSRLSDSEQMVVDAFIAARLLISDADGGDAILEVAHEALFRNWVPLRQAIEARVDDLRWRADLERWALDWERSGRQSSYLLRDERLRAAERWTQDQEDIATELPAVAELLDRSRHADLASMTRLSEEIATRALVNVDQDPEYSLLLTLTVLTECPLTLSARRAFAVASAASRCRLVLTRHTGAVRDVASSPDGGWLASASDDRTVRIWGIANGDEIGILHGHTDAVNAVAWSPDGRLLATGSHDRTVRVWDAHNGTELAVLLGHEARVTSLTWSPDGQQLATGSHDRTVRIWNTHNGTQTRALEGHSNTVGAVAWSPDGRQLATGSHDRTVRVWDAHNGTELAVLLGHEARVTSVTWSPDGRRLASASHDRTIRIWNPITRADPLVLAGHGDAVWRVTWSPDSRFVGTVSDDRTARIWDARNGSELLVMRGHTHDVWCCAWLPDGRRLATGSRDGTVRLWAAGESDELVILRGHDDAVRSVKWSPDSRLLASTSSDRTVRIWDVEHSTEVHVLRGHEDAVRGVAWSPDGKWLASVAHDRMIYLWNTENGILDRALPGHDQSVREVDWSPDGQYLATASYDRTVRIWNVDCGTEVRSLDAHGDTVRGVTWSPDGRWVATASDDRMIRVWAPKSGTVMQVFRGHEGALWSMAWSPDGQRLATTSHDRTVRIWDIHAGVEERMIGQRGDNTLNLAWSPDSKRLVVTYFDGMVRTWNAISGEELMILGVHTDRVEGVAWSPDGGRIATSSYDRTIRVWDAMIDLNTLVSRCRHRVFRTLSHQERRSLGLPQDPSMSSSYSSLKSPWTGSARGR